MARQDKARQGKKEGADKKITRGGCRRDAAWVYNETQLGVGCRLFGGGWGGGREPGGGLRPTRVAVTLRVLNSVVADWVA